MHHGMELTCENTDAQIYQSCLYKLLRSLDVLQTYNGLASHRMPSRLCAGRSVQERERAVAMAENQTRMTYREKLLQANREAKATVVALCVTIVAWIVLGFGLAGTGIEIAHTPIWVIGGTIGTWIVSLICCVVLAKVVFKDFDLDDEEAEDER